MNSTPKHIVFLSSRLDEPGGTERANLNAAQLFVDRGHKVSFVVLDETGKSFYPIDERVKIIHRRYFFGIGQNGNMFTRKWQLLRNIQGLKKLMKSLKPDVIISTDYPYSVALILAGCHKWTNVFSWEHHHYYWLKKSSFWNVLIKKTYPKLKSVIVYNKDEIPYYEAFGCDVVVVPNYLAEIPVIQDHQRQKTILTVGWLIKRKGVDMIPVIAKHVLQKHPGWKWKIIGVGELEQQLREQIKEFELEEKLIIEEPVKPLTPKEYQQVSLLVMTSRLEPFGLVLIEAMSNRVPCIAFDCPTGPRHIITHNEDGYLIQLEDSLAMAEAIETLISDELKRNAMANKAAQNVFRFSADEVYILWKKAIGE